jgi:hypothetical protein
VEVGPRGEGHFRGLAGRQGVTWAVFGETKGSLRALCGLAKGHLGSLAGEQRGTWAVFGLAKGSLGRFWLGGNVHFGDSCFAGKAIFCGTGKFLEVDPEHQRVRAIAVYRFTRDDYLLVKACY